MKIKRWICIILTFIFSFVIIQAGFAASKSLDHIRVINVVYDDSGSMYDTNGPVDTWCQAKYSMEVFAAMLGNNDYMNVYYMSDYEGSTAAGPRIILQGKDGAETNVSKIHNQTTTAGNTPFNAVVKANSDLLNMQADEKWLVVLTDGEFEDGKMSKADIDNFFASKPSDVSVMFLGMGPNASGITVNEGKNIYYIEAKSSNQILKKITEICTRVFNSNKLEIKNGNEITFDIPMEELTVFAQGEKVSINGIRKEDDSIIKSSRPAVSVKYSNCDTNNYNNSPVTSLVGSLANFNNISEGKYTLDVSNATTVEVYYKPNIDIQAKIINSEGEEVTENTDIPAGAYYVEAKIVKAGTDEEIGSSKLLGDISYEVSITKDGKLDENTYGNGDVFHLEEGENSISVTANYLDYNNKNKTFDYNVYRDKKIFFNTTNNPTYTVTSDGITEKDSIVVNISAEDHEITKEEWQNMDLPVMELKREYRDFQIDEPTIKKTDTIGQFIITPNLPDGKPSAGNYDNCTYKISYKQGFGSETWSGESELTMNFDDQRSWLERNWLNCIKIGILALILLIILGYMPFIKHYLPKALKRKPYILCDPDQRGEQSMDRKGKLEKSIISTIIPYIPQRGKLKIVPPGVAGIPALQIKGAKGKRMAITNIKAYADKEVTFDGELITKDTKKRFEKGANVTIVVHVNGWTYTCTPKIAKK